MILMFVALQRVKTGDWKFQNYDMNTSYLVSPPRARTLWFYSFSSVVPRVCAVASAYLRVSSIAALECKIALALQCVTSCVPRASVIIQAMRRVQPLSQ